jgi:hypothetical protein
MLRHLQQMAQKGYTSGLKHSNSDDDHFMRLFLALRAFFAVLSDKQKAIEIQKFLIAPVPAALPSKPEKASTDPSPSKSPSTKAALQKSTRSEALTLLSALQREARLLDLMSEPLDRYSDSQIGAAARDVIRDSKKCIDKLFSLRPIVEQSEGERIDIPSQPSPVRWKVLGGTSSKGTIVHPGWIAGKVELPSWTGGPEDDLVLSAVEVEVQ